MKKLIGLLRDKRTGIISGILALLAGYGCDASLADGSIDWVTIVTGLVSLLTGGTAVSGVLNAGKEVSVTEKQDLDLIAEASGLAGFDLKKLLSLTTLTNQDGLVGVTSRLALQTAAVEYLAEAFENARHQDGIDAMREVHQYLFDMNHTITEAH